MLLARIDESYEGSPRDTKIYIVAGYVSSYAQWWEFDRRWRNSMRALGIEAIGCHASKCATGAKPYDGMSASERNTIQQRLIEAIVGSGIFGCVAASDLDGWRKRRQAFSDLLGKDDKKYNEPHLMAIRQCVMLMFEQTERVTKEPIRFTFDQHREAGGRVREWCLQLATSNAMPADYRARMASCEEDDRTRVLGLQAADLLAYAAFRHFADRPSWQWDELVKAKNMTVMPFDEDYWQTIEDALKKEAAKKI